METIIQACNWGASTYLIFSENVFAPLIYYSHFLTISISLFVGFFVFVKGKKELSSKLLLALTILLSLWVFSDLVLWANEKPKLIMFFWSFLNLIEPFIYAVALYFFLVFLDGRDISLRKKITLGILLLPTVLFASTTIGLIGFDLSNCDRAAIEGPLAKYGYIIEVLFASWILFVGIYRLYKAQNRDEKAKILLITAAISAFLFLFSFGNIVEVFTSDWGFGQFGLLGVPIFVVLLGYLIVKYKSFNIKIISVQALVVGIWFLVFALLFIRQIAHVRIVTSVSLVFLTILGWFMIRSVQRELDQKEKLEQLRLRLEESNLGLANANDKLKSLDKLKSEFLSLAAHQLRSPLTAIKGYSSMLDEGSYGPLQPEQDEAIRRIYTSSQALINIVEDLLNVSKIEQGGMVYSFAPVELGNIVNMVCHEMEIPSKNKNLDFKLVISNTDKFMVVADATKIRQVILNLVDNAIKYTPQGFVEVSLKKEGDKIVFAVRDSGVGVTPETKEKLFQKFSRGEGGKLNTGGSGLGLYLAKEISKAHKGDVIIESEGTGKGSTFSLVLPMAGSQTKDFNVST